MTKDGRNRLSVEDLSNRPSGSDEAVYADVDALSDWWRQAIREHEAFGLRPYRPPRFGDGAICPPVVQFLEERHGVLIQLRVKNVIHDDEWEVWVDGTPAFAVERRRDPDGYSVIGSTRDEFVDRVERHVD